jgi:hypothetical protein
MVLCANDASSLSFVVPPEGTKPGDRITWDGYPGEPMEVKKMDKKKGWEVRGVTGVTDTEKPLHPLHLEPALRVPV